MTKWEDTIMSDEEVGRRWNIHQPTLVHGGLVKPLLEAQAQISFEAGEEEECKKWVKAFMDAGIMIAGANTVGIAVDETRREGMRKVVDNEAWHKAPKYTPEDFRRRK